MAALTAVREYMRELQVDAFICGSGDAHQSEYVSASEMRRAFVSGFTGSAGTALILQDAALLWTDGRYFLQASQQLSGDWTLMKSGEPGVLELNDWLATNLREGMIVGVDAFLISASQALATKRFLKSKGIEFKAVSFNPVDRAWEHVGGRPPAPSAPVLPYDSAFAGMTHAEKNAILQAKLKAAGAQALVVSMLDEIVWLFNIRGTDVDFNPVVISYAVVTLDTAHLFVDEAKLSHPQIFDHLGTSVRTHPYSSIESFLLELSSVQTVTKIAMDPTQLNWQLYRAVSQEDTASAGLKVLDLASPITMAKSLKNRNELDGIRRSHLRDGVALTAFLHWLETTVQAEPNSLSEYDAAEKLEEFRRKVPNHVCPSFSTIAGYGSNGAIIHYKPERDTAAKLGNDSLFLLDSGAQYLDGTTDVTRTVHFGEPTQRMKDCYTLVLKGHIALARAVFPEGTVGSRLDALARVPLWTAGLDYNHGTGHGVGAFLNVHEGPQGIGFRKRENEAGFLPGMTTSNEPGYYEEGEFGIRIENVCITVEADTPNNFNNKKYCAFETVTMTPIKTMLVNTALLNDDELEWLNQYHCQVREKLAPLMTEYFPEAIEYLTNETKRLERS